MIYQVLITAPAINEEVILEADSEQQAKERAVYSATQRMAKEASVTATMVPLDEDGHVRI
jgi:hypothetical protein